MSKDLVLYDLPSKDGNACWSPNTWKTRAALNFKGLPYRTEWTPYHELEPEIKSIGIPPNPEGSFASYTAPVVQFLDGSYLMDSDAIAKRLESEHPEPSLNLNDELEQQMQTVGGNLIFPMVPWLMIRVYSRLITEAEHDWFRRDREGRAGMTLEQWDSEKGGELAWKSAEPGFELFQKLLKEHKRDEGPFILGSQVCYADLMAAGVAEFFRRVEQNAFERLTGSVEGLRELYEACAPWFKRNDH